MEIIRVTAEEYGQTFPHPFSRFNSVAFTILNREKCRDIHYLVFRGRKSLLGIILGETADALKSPFSATYGGFSFNTGISLLHYDEACRLLREYGHRLGKQVIITLAPPLYDEQDNAKTFGAMMRAGARIHHIEYNHHFDLSLFERYDSLLDSKTRNKLHQAMSQGLEFQQLDSRDINDVARAYGIIRLNHEQRGYPVHMSLDDVLRTIRIIPADIFVITTAGGEDIAAAIIFHTSESVYQVVYWGDVPSFSGLRPMNLMAYRLFEHYAHEGIRHLDLGISTEEGTPNYGLCEFKENIGCSATSRFTLCL